MRARSWRRYEPATLFGMRALALLLLMTAQHPQYDDTITVVRYMLNVRVVDSAGRPVQDLTADDFSVRLAGKPATIESATWVRGGETAFRPDELEQLPPELAAPQPRTFVVYVQTDFGRNNARIAGQMKGNYVVDQIVAGIEPEARVAVLSHDSQLKLRSDFTRDRELTRKAIAQSIRIERTPPPPLHAAGDEGSLATQLDPDAMKRAATAEAGLLLIAKALRAIEGPKMILLAGWGLGELMPPGWTDAMQELVDQHVPVITLGTGLGGQLTSGLVATAKTTGGFYVGTQDFARQAINRATGAIAGQYEIALSTEELLPSGNLALEVKVNRRGLTVQAPPFVIHSR